MDKYKNEAKERFGTTDAYKEFESKIAGYSKADFAIWAEGLNEIFRKFADCKAKGNAPDSKEAQKLTKELQSFITENFYTCTDDILKGLGVMYSADERFKENIDKHGAGTTKFISSAIEIYTKD
ncbi:MAG: TipAS antibiotic-recognition domain-containing protein [Clostridia bacterium]|nr:TipAS antibiotic-recognition domain-containing protein [Clostridia bacterium]